MKAWPHLTMRGWCAIALRGEGDDVVGALQLREGVVLCIPPQLHAACARSAVYHACARPGQALGRYKHHHQWA